MVTFSNKKSAKNQPEFHCELCDYNTCKLSNYKQHLESKKHKCNTNVTKISQKFLCKNCVFESSDIDDFKIHFCTINEKCNKNQPKISQTYNCKKCDTLFNNRTSLWRHSKKCDKQNILDKENENKIIEKYENNIDKDELIHFLLNENKEFKMMMMEQNKQMFELAKNAGNNNTTHTNSHNQTFNLNVFLNETCKDAMNIMDFVNSMEINLDDLEKVGELGYVNGMTNIILKNLKSLDVTKRPLHCTDAKREIMYIKDENKWEKETENKDKIKKALKYIMHKNAKMLNVFKEKYPDCIKSYSKRSDQYNKLVVEVLGGKGDNEPQHNEKIIRKIAREVTIDKAMLSH